MIRYRNKLMPPADVNIMKHNFGQANPIRHYRLGNDCSCEIVHKLPYKEPTLLNNSYTKDYCPANSALKKINGTKYIFTNGSFKHAESVLQKLGIEKNFHSIHSIETSGYIPKPSKHAYEKMMLQENIDPLRAIMFEDTKWNLKTAKMLEMTTVLISSKNDLLENEKNDYIDYTITDLEEFLS